MILHVSWCLCNMHQKATLPRILRLDPIHRADMMMLLLAKSSILALQYQWRRLQRKDIDITNIDRPSLHYRENENTGQSGRKITSVQIK